MFLLMFTFEESCLYKASDSYVFMRFTDLLLGTLLCKNLVLLLPQHEDI